MNQKEVLTLIANAGIKPSDIVKVSQSLVSLNQASQWLSADKHNRKLSNPVIVMLYLIAISPPQKHQSTPTYIPSVQTPQDTQQTQGEPLPPFTGITPKLPPDGYIQNKRTIYFKFREKVYAFPYTGQSSIKIQYGSLTLKASADFSKIIGPVSVGNN